MSNVEVKTTITTRGSSKKIVLCNQCSPADGTGGVICGLLLLLLEKPWARRDSIEKPSENKLGESAAYQN